MIRLNIVLMATEFAGLLVPTLKLFHLATRFLAKSQSLQTWCQYFVVRILERFQNLGNQTVIDVSSTACKTSEET